VRRRAAAALALALLALRANAAAEEPIPAAFAALSLDQAESASVLRSPDVAAAQAVVREDAAALASARGALGPSINTTYAVAPQGGPLGETIQQRITTVQVQTTVGDVLAYAPLVAAADATLRAARASLAAATREERVKAVALYYDALKARAIASAREEALATAKEQRRAAAIRAGAGDAPRLDVVRADVAVARATANVETARAAEANALDALRAETGATALDTTVDAAPAQPLADLTPDAAVTEARANRADLRAAEASVAVARASAAAARRGALPALTVAAGYAQGVDSGVNVHGPAINVSLGIPLNGAARAQAAQREAAVGESVAKEQAQERQLALDVAAAARNVAAARRATAASDEARGEALAELRATELGYRNGASSSLELASARDTYTQAVVDALSSEYDELKARATLHLEIGP